MGSKNADLCIPENIVLYTIIEQKVNTAHDSQEFVGEFMCITQIKQNSIKFQNIKRVLQHQSTCTYMTHTRLHAPQIVSYALEKRLCGTDYAKYV